MASSSSRPMNAVSRCGSRSVGADAAAQRREVVGKPGDVELEEPLRLGQALEAVGARGRGALQPPASSSLMSARAESETTIWPPQPAAAMRAARLTSKPP